MFASLSLVQSFKSSRTKLRFNSALASIAKPRVLSGIQPTGCIHIGAVKQWVENQENFDNYFCIVDLHAVTSAYDQATLHEETLKVAGLYFASGIDPNKSKVFIQSRVRAHTELSWLLSCVCPISWLERMTQFKEKSLIQNENVRVGLFTYPMLMAADILLYQAKYVPVGDDQLQHLELTRDICRKFNQQFCSKDGRSVTSPVFCEPQVLLPKEGARIMSLTDGTKKMSKSSESDYSRINLLDSADDIDRKIKKCKTDSISGLEWGNPQRPECTNLLRLYMLASNKTVEEIEVEASSLKWGTFKPLLSEALITHLEPIRNRYLDLMKDKSYLESLLMDGEFDANEIAENTLCKAKDAMGFYKYQSITRKS